MEVLLQFLEITQEAVLLQDLNRVDQPSDCVDSAWQHEITSN